MLKKLFNINQGEGFPTLILFLHFFAYVAISITGSAARDAYFLNMVDRKYLPLMFLAVAIVLSIVIEIYSRLSKNKDLSTIVSGTGIIFIATLFAIQKNLEGWVIPFLYVWKDVIDAIIITQFWLIASQVFDPRQAKRLFGLLGAGGALAAIIIGSSIKQFVSIFGSENLLFATMSFLLVVILMANLIRPYRNINEQKNSNSKKDSQKDEKKSFSPYLKSLAIIIGLAAVASRVVDYQFKITAVAAFPEQDDLVNFFGQYYAVTGIATMVIQLFITSRLLSRFGILVAILVLPTLFMTGAIGFLMSPVLAAVYISKFSDQVFRFTLHNASIQLLWIPVKNTIKNRLKPVIEGSIRASLEGVSGILIFLSITVFNVPIHYLSISIVLIAIYWINKSFTLKKLYVKELQSAIEKRELNFEELTLDIQDEAMVKTINEALKNNDESQQILALEMIKDIPLTPWKDSLNDLLNNGEITVKKEILSISFDDENIITNQTIIDLINNVPDLETESIEIAGKRRLRKALPIIMDRIDTVNKEKQIIFAAAIRNIDPDSSNKEKELLLDAFNTNDENICSLAIRQMKNDKEILPDDKLAEYLNQESSMIRDAALSVAESRASTSLLPHIIQCLSDPRCAIPARSALQAYDDNVVVELLIKHVQRQNVEKSLIIGVIRTIKNYPTKNSIDLLLSAVSPKVPPIQSEAVDSLIHIARELPLDENQIIITKKELIKTSRYAYEKIIALSQINEDEENQLLRYLLQNEVRKLIPVIMKLGILDKPETPIETYIQYVLNNETDKLPYVLEFFENIFSKEERRIVNSLIDNIPIEEKCEVAKNHFDDLTTNINQFLGYYIGTIQELKVALTLDYAFRNNNQEILEKANWNEFPDSFIIKDIITRHAKNNPDSLNRWPINDYLLDSNQLTMYSTLEKAMILKSVDLFASIPSQELIRVAQIAEEEEYQPDTSLCKEGDFGDCMYIIANGKVKVHKGDRTLVELEKGAFVGDMALLDQEPRSADLTTSAETTLLKISQDAFYELMSSNFEIMNGILKIISSRLREAQAKL
ncbi:MAG: Npt1/Npt2 family nucleotide transporter [Candidatus Neomarinimicrobiota bacterium]|nr:Npt1/Npt2 family nucleotide transporter [Candidatus Neomarinimicrobiota bacterium]